MNFFNNVMKSSNALIKDRLNDPFGKQQKQTSVADQQLQDETTTINSSTNNQESGSQATTSTASDAITANTADNPSAANQPNIDDVTGDNNNKNSQFAAIAADAEAVTQKAVESAKTFGNFLFSMANKAGQTVSQTAKQVKQVVESTSILADFSNEQQEFIKEHGGNIQPGELPWAACGNEESCKSVKEQVLSLSQDKRNFVRSPPAGVDFQFEPQSCYPVALSLLKEDSNLNTMRFEIVPKLVNEDTFWRNYFYRVSLIKQSVQTKSQEGTEKRAGWSSSRSSSGEGPDEINNDTNQADEASPQHSARQQSFNTQEYESSESRKLVAEADDLKSKLKELNIGSLDEASLKDDEKWEEELTRDLQEFEVVSGDVSALDEDALEKDIQELTRIKNSRS